MNISITNFSKDLGAYQKLASFVAPPPSTPLYASLLYSKSKNAFFFATKDALSFFSFEMEGLVQGDASDFGIKIDPSTLFYIIDNYSEDVVKQLTMSFIQEEDNAITLSVVSPLDTILVPCSNMDADDVEDSFSLIEQNKPDKDKSILLSNAWNYEALRGINESLNFMGSDDMVHNALALYSNRVSYNDKRHIFVFYIPGHARIEEFENDDDFVPIHKKPAKILDYFFQKGVEFSAYLSNNKKFIWIVYGKSIMKVNNTLSNIAPPSNDILTRISPSNLFCEVSLSALQETSNFFTGFFSKAEAWKVITLLINKDEIIFELKSSSNSTSSCNVKRSFPVDMDADCDLSKITKSVNLVNDSLLTFLKLYKGKQDEKVKLYIDDEKGGVLLSYSNKQILLAKLDN